VPVETSMAISLARYGSQAAIPESVKREILTKAGILIPPDANIDTLLGQQIAKLNPTLQTP